MAQDDNRDLTHVKPGIPIQRITLAASADYRVGERQLAQVLRS